MPKLWTDTIEAHRQEVKAAVMDTTAALIDEHGLLSVTMSRIAEETGIGRGTLYKYFPDVESILSAWHERQVADHLAQLAAVSAQTARPADRLHAVVEAYALIVHSTHSSPDIEVVARLHRGQHVVQAHRQLLKMLRDLISDAAANGDVRTDVPPDELAVFCLHALAGASSVPSRAAVHRLVTVTLAGLRDER